MPRGRSSHSSGGYESSASSEGSVGQSQQKKKRKNECAARTCFMEIQPKIFACNLCAKINPSRPVMKETNKYSCSTVLSRHLRNVHRKEHNELKAQEGSSSSQPSVANIFDRKSGYQAVLHWSHTGGHKRRACTLHLSVSLTMEHRM